MTRWLPWYLFASMLAACGGWAPPPRPPATPFPDSQRLVEAYYDRVSREDLRGVLDLLDADPVMVEPFSDPGDVTVRRGYRDVAEFFHEAFARRTDHLVPEFIHGRGRVVEAGWSLEREDGFGVSGLTVFEIRRGLIHRIEVRIRD